MRQMSPDALRPVEAAIADAERGDLPALVGELARLQALATARLAERGEPNAAPNPTPDRLLDVHEAAEMLGVSAKWVYANAERLGVVKLSPRAVRFPERAVQRYILARQQGGRT